MTCSVQLVVVFLIYVIASCSLIAITEGRYIDDVLLNEGLMPWKHEGRQKVEEKLPPVTELALPPRMVISPQQKPKLTKQPVHRPKSPDMEDMLESELLLPFDNRPLSRYRRAANPDDNIEGSGGDDSSTAAPTIQCHELTCIGQDCISAFNNTDPSQQCTTTGSCYIRAKFNESHRFVESKCDSRPSCEWQMFEVDSWVEVSTCCDKPFCNILEQLKGGSDGRHSQQTVFTALASLVFVYIYMHASFHGDNS